MEPTLFKIMIPHDEHLENVLVLLGDNNCFATSSHASVLDLPTKDDVPKFLGCGTSNSRKSSLVYEMCVAVWMEDEMRWYIGFVCKNIGDDKCLVEHLERYPSSQNEFWRHPKVEDVQAVFKGKTLLSRVDGMWNGMFQIYITHSVHKIQTSIFSSTIRHF